MHPQRPDSPDPSPALIFAVSDATATTAERAVRAALAQFPDAKGSLRIFPQVRDSEHLRRVLDLAHAQHALVIYTLVDPLLREEATRAIEEAQLRGLDLFGPLLHHLGRHLGQRPAETPGLSAPLDEDYFRRIEAVEFAVQNDDGQNPRYLERADIVLVGVSRTSKTPVSAILAGRGFKVANVPLVPGVEPPAALYDLPPGTVFGLTIDPLQLQSIRRRRVATMGVRGDGGYTDEAQVFAEVRWALDYLRRRGKWPVIDVTQMAVEETAAEILRLRFALRGESD